MNGKKAKLLRADTKARSKGLPWTNYDKANEKIKLVEVGMGSDGLPLKKPWEVFTLVLGACQKATYKDFKKIYKSDKSQASRSRLKRK